MSNTDKMENSANGNSAEGSTMSPAENGTHSDFINSLNDDCLATVFSFLPVDDKFAIQTVCKHWRGNPHLTWQDMKFLDLASVDLLGLAFWSKGRVKLFFKRCGSFVQHLKLGFNRRRNKGDIKELTSESE